MNSDLLSEIENHIMQLPPHVKTRKSTVLLASAAKEIRRLATVRECEWKMDVDGFYETSCGEIFQFIEGTPSDNSCKYCPYCGGILSDT